MARPIYTGFARKDTKNIANDLQRKDVNKAFRQSARLKTITKKSDKCSREQRFFSMLTNVELIEFPGDANLGEFSCSVDDYRDFLVNDAPKFSELNLTRVKLLLDRETGNSIAYMALLCDAIQLDTAEVQQMDWDIPFRTIPALKIGKRGQSSV